MRSSPNTGSSASRCPASVIRALTLTDDSLRAAGAIVIDAPATDPRATKLLVFADELGVSGRYVDLLRKLSAAMDRAAGKPITLNATGAIAALLLEIGLPADVMRGLAVVSRSGGLIAHIQEERETHLAREIWSYVENNIPYEK